LPIVAYIILCVLVGYLGRNSRVGFWGVAVLSAVFTPVITGLVMMMLGERTENR
jgi:xanthine/uracil permease